MTLDEKLRKFEMAVMRLQERCDLVEEDQLKAIKELQQVRDSLKFELFNSDEPNLRGYGSC